MEEEKEEKPISQYNAAAAINQRIQNCWNKIVNFSTKGLFNKWNLELDAIWRELVGDLTEEKLKEWEKKFQEIENKLAKIGVLSDGHNGFKTPNKTELLTKNKQYILLQEKHVLLKQLEKELGKGTKFKEGVEDYMAS